uniref:MORN repeat protein n=1 Tax=Mimivirus LCMiAC01 TaxID=2506608 RepID=A0A481YZ74_9VIRU|nr:MAG: MORN repeat protein [Mimivirus LCMiAC01]
MLLVLWYIINHLCNHFNFKKLRTSFKNTNIKLQRQILIKYIPSNQYTDFIKNNTPIRGHRAAAKAACKMHKRVIYKKYVHKGEFANGKRNDNGIYTGFMKNNKMHGYGVYNRYNGCLYEGEFVNGEQSGCGICTYPTGGTYKGYWKNDKVHGYGVYKLNDNHCYEGEFVNGNQHGYGIYTWPSGGVYKGYWKNDRMAGFSRYRRNDGVTYFGTWFNDNRVGCGTKICPPKIDKDSNWKMVAEKMYHEMWGKNGKLFTRTEIIKPIFRRDTCFVDCIIVCEDD